MVAELVADEGARQVQLRPRVVGRQAAIEDLEGLRVPLLLDQPSGTLPAFCWSKLSVSATAALADRMVNATMMAPFIGLISPLR